MATPASQEERDAMIDQFCRVTSAPPHEAELHLSTSHWDLSSAVTEYYTSLEDSGAEALEDDAMTDDAGDPLSASGAQLHGRTLGGPAAPVPVSSTAATRPASSAPPKAPPSNKKFATLRDLNQDQGHSHGHGHGHGDDEEEDDAQRDLFAGGEKSALAVQNPSDPRNQVKEILDKARKYLITLPDDAPGDELMRGRNLPRPGGEESSTSTSRFRGAGQTLGGDDTPSQVIPDPHAQAPRPRAPVTRTLHFWRDGFSVEDGTLYRFDDPANNAVLSLIRSGRAPLDIMEVEPDQLVDVTVHQHEENYVQPKKKYKPFGSGGQRLGSPTPGADVSSGHTVATTAIAPSDPASSSSSSSNPVAATGVVVDESQPTINLQIRLADGTRQASRFNTTHTIGDVYAYIEASMASAAGRPWVLMTTFPSKELTDRHIALGDLAELKRGGVVVQKWA
ncbi:MAG: hypothetical protein M1838_004757 [Thelocarpon superellum]|nr:MAG: hypothetical protein M1838_004757 [Thelocarpon superellum]